MEGDLLETKKWKKSCTGPKQIQGGPAVSSEFVGYVKNGVNESRDTLH